MTELDKEENLEKDLMNQFSLHIRTYGSFATTS